MHYQYLPDRGPFNRERIWEPFHDEQPAYIVPPIANFPDGPSGLVYYPRTGFGDQLKNKFLLCDFRGTPAKRGVRTFQLEPDGAFYSLSTNQRPIWSVLATDVAFAPDGSLLISDWVDGWKGVGKGRLYRVTDPRHDQSPIVKEVFRLLSGDWCLRCHKVNGKEGDVGPDLAKIAKEKDRRYLLESICLPSRVIAKVVLAQKFFSSGHFSSYGSAGQQGVIGSDDKCEWP